jgi:hypothetical protein
MAKREQCTFLLNLFSNEAVNSFPQTEVLPSARLQGGRGEGRGGGRVINLRTSGAEIYDGLFRYLEYLAGRGVGGDESRDV